MTDQQVLDVLRADGLLTLALTMTGEAVGDAADGSSIEERLAVACVVRNRVRAARFGVGYAGVCLKPWQFSCWNAGDPNRPRLLALAAQVLAGGQDPRFSETRYLAGGVVQDAVLDLTRGATHYFNPRVVPAPAWAYTDKSKTTLRRPSAVVGAHQFYAGIA